MSLDAFFEESVDISGYSDSIDLETRKRIRVALAAYAYEVMQQPFMSDHDYDTLAMSIDLNINTRRPDLDKWFRQHFKPYTGSWIHAHPERHKLKNILLTVFERNEV